MNKTKSSGPKIEPCGTPDLTLALDDFCPANQVEFIQSQLVELLHSLVGGEDRLDIKNGYQELQQ